MRGLSDKVVIVTGGGGGIGTATCQRFSQEGAKVAVFDIDADSAGRTAAQITEVGGKAEAFGCDITEHAACQRAVSAAEVAMGPIDILVNNAGWDVFRPFVETSPSDWEKTISINLTGALNMHHAVLPGMVARQRGRIVNISSDAARVGSSGEAVYAACKAGLIGFSKTIAREHARHNINVNVVCPGIVNTKLYENYKKGARNPDKLDDVLSPRYPFRPPWRAGGSAGRNLFSCQRRRGLRHRTSDKRIGWPHNGRLNVRDDTNFIRVDEVTESPKVAQCV